MTMPLPALPGATPLGMEDLKLYINHLPQDDELLHEVIPDVTRALPGILNTFYDKIVDNPIGKTVLDNAGSHIEILKTKLHVWILDTLTSPLDNTYTKKQHQIGVLHLKIDLPHSMVILGGNLIRTSLENVIFCCFRNRGGELSRALAAMNKRLDISLALLLNSYNEDRVRMVQEKVEMENANMIALGRMSASIAHEVKNPLAGISGAIQILRERLRDNGGVVEVLDNVLVEIRRLGATVTDLLDFARPLRLSHNQIPLSEIVAGASSVLESDPLFATVKVHHDDETAGHLILVDSVRLMTVLQNLFINAAQAMQGRGAIRVHSRLFEEAILLDVRDSGPGVPEDWRDQLFEPFATSKVHGTGLGLAICRKIAQSHGGDITLLPSDSGACFRITLRQGKP